MNFKVKKIRHNAIIPTKAHKTDAGFDLCACLDEPIQIKPGENVKIPTGVAIGLPEGTFGAIFARSGLAAKQGLRPANCVGVADSEYTGEYMVALYNDSKDSVIIYQGDRIAQLVVLPFVQGDMIVVDELEATERGDNGFGSTGVN